MLTRFKRRHDLDPQKLLEQEPDAGLGNGGLGRLAACFLDSMATLGIPGTGYGLRYEYGIFRQAIRDGWQTEQPDHWLVWSDPWEVARPNEAVEVKLNCSFEIRSGELRAVEGRPSSLIGIPYDRPVVGYGGKTINTLRLWAAGTLGYTNHTLLPEALEKWPVAWFEHLLPRHLEIIYEINRRFLNDVRVRFPGDEGRVSRVSLIEEGSPRQVRMAHLAIVGSHSINGVAALHSDLLKRRVMPDFAAMFPERFNNKTNGVTPRRWLLLANPALAQVITEAIGDAWITDLAQLEKLRPLADDKAFHAAVRKAKRAAKTRFIDWLKRAGGPAVDPDTIFDTQIKRIHEYKRQLLNVLHVIVHYNRLRANPHLDVPPRTFFFAGKATPAYHRAKLIINLINNVADTIDGNPAMKNRIRVVFVPDYRVLVAEQLIPASDVSEQISTAGYEASGASNVKFMMNGVQTSCYAPSSTRNTPARIAIKDGLRRGKPSKNVMR